jgi:hypothetical protein
VVMLDDSAIFLIWFQTYIYIYNAYFISINKTTFSVATNLLSRTICFDARRPSSGPVLTYTHSVR